MSKDFAVVLPVRDGGTGRANRLKECLNSWHRHTEGLSKVYVILDEDDIHNFSYLSKLDPEKVEVLLQSEKNTLMQKINTFSDYIADNHKYMIFIGDDILFTCPWESKFAEYFESVPYGIAYANDGIQGERLATHPCVSSNLVKALGFFGCPGVAHNFFDNYWVLVGSTTGYIKYFPDILMQHKHYINGTSGFDIVYSKSHALMKSDQAGYSRYLEENFPEDLEKIGNISDKNS